MTRKSTIFRLRAPIACSLAALALGAALPSSASAARCSGAYANPSSASTATIRGATLCLLNAERRQRGMPRLSHNARLAEAATRHAKDMVRRRYFSHFSPSGADAVDRIRRTNYVRSARTWTVGENIAWGAYHMATPHAIVRMWMKSAGHRHNILNRRFREIGIGIARGAPRAGMRQAGTYATDFGFRG